MIESMATFAVAAALAGAASGATEIKPSANVALTTNYLFRGVSQTDLGPAIQGGFDLLYGDFYAGVWGSSVDFNNDTTMEVDFYGGYAPTIGSVTLDIGVIYYVYPDSPELPTGGQNFLEVYAGATRAVGPVELSAKAWWSPDYYGGTGDSGYFQVGASTPITEKLTISAGAGAFVFRNKSANNDYRDYNLGVTYSDFGFDFDLRGYDTDGRSGGNNDDTVVFSISRSF